MKSPPALLRGLKAAREQAVAQVEQDAREWLALMQPTDHAGPRPYDTPTSERSGA